jgi:ATP-binding cassette subfamily B protein
MAKRHNGEPLKEEEKRSLNKASLNRLRRIFGFMKPYRGLFIFGLISLVVSNVTVMAFPRLAGELLDVATAKPKYFSTVNQVAAVMIGVLFVQSIFSFIRVYTFSIVTERGIADIRKAVYHKIIWSPMSFFDSRRVGELMSRISADVGTLHGTFSFTFAELLRQIMTLLSGVVIIFFMAPKLASFMLLTFPIIVIGALYFGKQIRKISRKTQDMLAEANVVVEESLQSISVVKAFTNELFEINRYAKSLMEAVRIALTSSRFNALFVSFVVLVVFGGIVGVGWFGARMVQANEISVGQLFSFVLYTGFIGASIGGLGDIYAQLQRSIGASERVLDILAQEDEAVSDAAPSLNLKGAIEFRDVSFSYPSRTDFTVLKHLNFTIDAGERIALVGQSGSGKSTIINLLLRLYPLNLGKIVVDGFDIKDLNSSAYRKNFGIVPQEVILFGGTIKENIEYGKPGASVEEIEEAARKANAFDFIESFPEKFNTIVGERGVKLSGGQRQRIAIARAILKDPVILILDEATSSLDMHSEALVQEALEKLMANRTTIIIAHRLSTIKKVDRIFVIKEGSLAEMGSHAELTSLNDGIYSNLLKLQLH